MIEESKIIMFKFLMFSPAATMGISSLFGAFNIWNKCSKKYLLASPFIFLVFLMVSMIIQPMKITFILLSMATGYVIVIMYTIPYLLVTLMIINCLKNCLILNRIFEASRNSWGNFEKIYITGGVFRHIPILQKLLYFIFP